jgi:hypothetical protein
MNVTWENLRNVLTVAGSAGVFSALTIILGRLWTQSYYSVFGLPTSDLEFSVMDYAFQTKEVLLMLALAALISIALTLPEGVRGFLVSDLLDVRIPFRRWAEDALAILKDRLGRPLLSFLGAVGGGTRPIWRWLRFLSPAVVPVTRQGWRVLWWVLTAAAWLTQEVWGLLADPLGLVGKGLLLVGLAGLLSLTLVAMGKPQSLDWTWQSVGLLGLWGGVSLGLTIGVLAVLVWQQDGFGPALPAVGIIALLTVFLPWSIGELAEFQALRDIRKPSLPQAIIEFRGDAPAAIRRSDDSSRSELVYVVLATKNRLAIAYPFGCRQVGEPTKPPARLGDGTPQSETCDIFTIDRKDVRTMRIFASNAEVPFNDERTNPDDVQLLAGEPTPYDQNLDLTAAHEDNCDTGDGQSPIPDNYRGVWLRLDALQSGRLLFDHRPEGVYLSPPDTQNCIELMPDDAGVRLSVGDQLMLLATAPEADRISRRLAFTFLPLEFSGADIDVREGERPAGTPVPFRVEETSSISVTTDLNGDPPECIHYAPPGSDAKRELCQEEDAGVETSSASVTFTTEELIGPGLWELSFGTAIPQSFRIQLSPLPTEFFPDQEPPEQET